MKAPVPAKTGDSLDSSHVHVVDAADDAMGLTHGRYPDRPRSKAHSQGGVAARQAPETAGVQFIDENGGRPSVPEGTSRGVPD